MTSSFKVLIKNYTGINQRLPSSSKNHHLPSKPININLLINVTHVGIFSLFALFEMLHSGVKTWIDRVCVLFPE